MVTVKTKKNASKRELGSPEGGALPHIPLLQPT